MTSDPTALVAHLSTAQSEQAHGSLIMSAIYGNCGGTQRGAHGGAQGEAQCGAQGGAQCGAQGGAQCGAHGGGQGEVRGGEIQRTYTGQSRAGNRTRRARANSDTTAVARMGETIVVASRAAMEQERNRVTSMRQMTSFDVEEGEISDMEDRSTHAEGNSQKPASSATSANELIK